MRPRTFRLNQMTIGAVGLMILALPAHAQQAATPVTTGSPSGSAASSTPGTQTGDGEAVIVTGTRDLGRKARDSLSPIDVVTAHDIADTGQTDLTQALVQLLPSVTTPAVGIFDGSPTDLIRLRVDRQANG